MIGWDVGRSVGREGGGRNGVGGWRRVVNFGASSEAAFAVSARSIRNSAAMAFEGRRGYFRDGT